MRYHVSQRTCQGRIGSVNNSLSFLTGLAVGAGLTFAARDLAPALAPHARTLTKRGLKLAVLGFERGREALALTAESLSDLLAEVQAELQAERAMPPQPAPANNGSDLLAELLADEHAADVTPEA